MRFLVLGLLLSGCSSLAPIPRQQQHLLDRMSREQEKPVTWKQLQQVKMSSGLVEARQDRIDARLNVNEEALRRLLDQMTMYLEDIEKRIEQAKEPRAMAL